MLEELGRINEGRKAFETVEKILKERMKTLLDGKTALRSDNFNLELKGVERTALNQGKAKAYFEEQGTLADYMSTTVVPTMYVKPN